MREHERDLRLGDIEKRNNFSPHERMNARVRGSGGQEEGMEEDMKAKWEK